jgi:hypothetical protein
LVDRAASEGGSLDLTTGGGKSQYIKMYEAILDEVYQNLDRVFDIFPGAKVKVVPREVILTHSEVQIQPNL